MAQHIKRLAQKRKERVCHKERNMVTKIHEKRPCRKPAAGAVLVDGHWQLTELSAQIAAERLMRDREQRRSKLRELGQLVRQSRPDLFVFARKDPQQTTLTEPETPRRERNARDISPTQ